MIQNIQYITNNTNISLFLVQNCHVSFLTNITESLEHLGEAEVWVGGVVEGGHYVPLMGVVQDFSEPHFSHPCTKNPSIFLIPMLISFLQMKIMISLLIHLRRVKVRRAISRFQLN